MRLHYLTTISTTCGAINVSASLKEFYVVVNRDIFLTTIATTCGAINVPAPLKGFYVVVNRDMA